MEGRNKARSEWHLLKRQGSSNYSTFQYAMSDNHWKKLLILSWSFSLVGCATTTVAKLGPLPVTNEDYNLPKEELIRKYPEINNYEIHKTDEKVEVGGSCFDRISCGLSILSPPREYPVLKAHDDSQLPLQADVLAVLGKPTSSQAI